MGQCWSWEPAEPTVVAVGKEVLPAASVERLLRDYGRVPRLGHVPVVPAKCVAVRSASVALFELADRVQIKVQLRDVAEAPAGLTKRSRSKLEMAVLHRRVHLDRLAEHVRGDRYCARVRLAENGFDINDYMCTRIV